MDARLEKALKFANYRQTLQQERENLQLKVNEQLTYGHNGGIFLINQELIGFVAALLSKTDSSILLDQNNIPIEIVDLAEFQDEILSRYMEAVNEFHEQYQELKKARSVKHVLGWDNDE